MNVTYAGFAGRADEWAVNGNDRGAANLVAYQKFLARQDISLTHTLIHATIDKGRGNVPNGFNDTQLHKLCDTEHGILVRGARVLATLAPSPTRSRCIPPADAAADAAACAVLLHPHGHAGAEIHLPRQLLAAWEQRSIIRCPADLMSRMRL